MSNNNDLSILIKTIIEQTSKQNVIAEVDALVNNLQKKLNTIQINIGGAGFQQLISQLNAINSASQSIKIPRFNFDVPTTESKKFLTAIGSIENTLSATGRTAISTWDEFGNVTMKVTNTTKGLVENFKYQWDSANQSLIRVNRQQQDNMLSLEQLQAKYKGMTNTLNNGKLGNFIDKSALQSFENSLKNIQVLDAKILADLKNQFDQIKLNAQANKENFNLGQNLDVYKNRMNNFIDNNVQKYGWQVDTSSLNNFKNQINQLNSSTPNLSNVMKSINQEVRNITNNIKLETQELNSVLSINEKISNEIKRQQIAEKNLTEQIKISRMTFANEFSKF